jgi:type IV pilus assembly protein PilC
VPGYVYLAKDTTGRNIKGAEDAETVPALVSSLRSRGLTVISVDQQRGAADKPRSWKNMALTKKKVKLNTLANFCRQVATMLDAGLPVVESLETVGEQLEHQTLREVVEDVRRNIEAGDSFSEALGKHPGVFSVLFVSMIEAGEEAGALPKVMSQLASYLEARAQLQRKIKSAMAYPAFISVFFFMAVCGVVFFLIPKFEDIFSGFDVPLPRLTQGLINFSRFLTEHILIEIGLIIGLIVLYKVWSSTENGRYFVDSKKLKIPLVGRLLQKSAIARFTQTLGTLMGNGVGVVGALEIVSMTSGNVAIAKAVKSVARGVTEGSAISAELSKHEVFPKIVVNMTSAGEESGSMPEMMERLAGHYNDEVETAVAGLTAMIEPALIIGLGAVVLVVVLAIYLPIFKMATSMT